MKQPEILGSLIVALLLSFALSVLLIAGPEWYEWIAGKDLLIEDLTFWFFLAAGTVLLFALKRSGPARSWTRERSFFLFWGVLFFVAALEEVNWGQDIFLFTPPKFFIRYNQERAVNIHNFASVPMNRAFYLFAFIIGVALPAIALISEKGANLFRQGGIVVPTFSISLLFMLSFAHISSGWLAISPEGYGYIYCSIGGLAFLISQRKRLKIPAFLTLGAIATLGLILLTHFVYLSFNEHLVTRNRPNEVKEFFLGWSFFLYAVQLLRKYPQESGDRA